VIDKLTGAERELADAARDGLAYVTDAPVRAAVLRELLLGLRGPVDPRGVRVGGARIAGTLNLDHVEAAVGLALVDCVVVNTISARAATLPWLELSGSRIAGFDGTGVRIGHDLDLTGVRATGSGDFGVICLRDARVDGLTVFARAEIRSGDGPALYLDDLECRAVKGIGLRATGAGGSGAIRLLGARVSSEIHLGEAVLTNGSGPAVHADGVLVDGDLNLAGASVTGAGEDGALRLLGARVGGQVDFGDAVLANDSGPAVGADRLRAGGLYATGVTTTGAFSLLGARVDGQINLGGAVLANPGGRALSADSARVEGSVHANGLRASGTLSLMGTQVAGRLYLMDAELTDGAGASLIGDRLRVDGGLRLTGLTATGTIHLAGGRVGGYADLDGVRGTSAAGPALEADDLHVDGPLDLNAVRLTGTGGRGALRLPRAEVAGQFALDGAVLENDTGSALVADRCQVRENVRLAELRATGAGELAPVSLLGARIAGQLTFDGAEIVNTAGQPLVNLEDAAVEGAIFLPADLVCSPSVCQGRGQVSLAGLQFGSLAGLTWQQWLHLIRSHTAEYRPGPYQRLAASERAAGHDGNARQILIAQQRDLQRRAPEAIGGWPARRFHWLWGALAGYGYRARRTAAVLLLAVVAAGGLGFWAGHVGDAGHRAAERTADLAAARGTPCTTVELIGVGLDRGLPLSPGVRGRCDLNTGIAAGQWFTVAIWLVQAAIWALATLALVGYTGLVRKTG
jgi:cytoskeletal protein CcmA (bactofilin family)